MSYYRKWRCPRYKSQGNNTGKQRKLDTSQWNNISMDIFDLFQYNETMLVLCVVIYLEWFPCDILTNHIILTFNGSTSFCLELSFICWPKGPWGAHVITCIFTSCIKSRFRFAYLSHESDWNISPDLTRWYIQCNFNQSTPPGSPRGWVLSKCYYPMILHIIFDKNWMKNVGGVVNLSWNNIS